MKHKRNKRKEVLLMIKKLMVAVLVFSALFLFLGCAQTQTIPKDTQQAIAEEIPATGQESVDQVASGISDINDAEEDLDTSELDDLDSILSDIGNI